MSGNLPRLDVTESTGRRMPKVWKDEADQLHVLDAPSTPCPGCGHVTAEGELITKVLRAWWHAACAEAWLAQTGEDEAWRTIARQMAAHPSRYRTPEIRVVIEQLLRMSVKS